ncbi:putative D(1) dopomine receptor-like protein [Mammaliicoccus virus vB_MscM-PMS2]|nr:putative D(1) dopomine receptor-like protein [Mammaliicoccus virus vB_MscM-PMS2]
MTFIYIVFYFIILGVIGFFFIGTLEDITVTDEDGSTRQVDGLTKASWIDIGIALAWTAFAFWFIASQSLAYVFYY